MLQFSERVLPLAERLEWQERRWVLGTVQDKIQDTPDLPRT